MSNNSNTVLSTDNNTAQELLEQRNERQNEAVQRTQDLWLTVYGAAGKTMQGVAIASGIKVAAAAARLIKTEDKIAKIKDRSMSSYFERISEELTGLIEQGLVGESVAELIDQLGRDCIEHNNTMVVSVKTRFGQHAFSIGSALADMIGLQAGKAEIRNAVVAQLEGNNAG